MAESIVSFLVESIGKLLMEEGKFLTGVSQEAGRLHSELKMITAFLKDADVRPHENVGALVKECVSQCKDVAYEAENILEDYAFRLASRTGEKGTISVLKRLAGILNECYIRHKVGLQIQSLNSRISDLTRKFQEYGVKAVAEKGESSGSSRSRLLQQRRMTYSSVAEDEDFVGFRHDVETLVEKLMKGDDVSGQYGVVSINGMGGCGKTTLARKVYNHPSVKGHFDAKAWVCISQQWQTRNLLQGILVSFLPDRRQEIDRWSDNEIVGELLRFQKDKKCLVVLDDIWSIDAWESIEAAFPLRKEGNKILITTRNENVAKHIGPHGYHHKPRLLSEDEGWELLQKKALNHELATGYGDIYKLEALGREMVRLCGRLPLAVVVLGGILATKESSFHEWNSVSRNIKVYLGKGESIIQQQQGEGKVGEILALSYYDLPYNLKPCFLYLSGFREDEDIDVLRLYHLWIAEGMVLEKDRVREEETMIDVAERYLEELAKRCIVQVKSSGSEFARSRKYESCRMHDLMRDLCLAKSREEKFLEVIHHGLEDGASPSTNCNTSSIHRVTVYVWGGKDEREIVPSESESARRLIRTLALHYAGELILELPMPMPVLTKFDKFKMLRSLILDKVACMFEFAIGKLIHLRYLNLSSSYLILSPASMNRLQHLETLDVSGLNIEWTNKDVPLKLTRLRHLYLESSLFREGAVRMQIIVPSTIEIIRLYNAIMEVRSFSEVTNLRELYVLLNDDLKDVEETIKFISNSNLLREATFKFSKAEAVLPLFAPLFSSNLQYLSLFGPLQNMLPKHHSQMLRNLSQLHMYHSELRKDPMETLEKLPCLQKLILGTYSFAGEEMVCHSTGFPELRYLLFEDLPFFEKWTVEVGAMPNLAYLHMNYCGLTSFPEGLLSIATLKDVVLVDMIAEFMSDYALKSKTREIQVA
ncbi:OLC1v1019642C1 [Oldenlandia corymbosa var. corymbosa]|uniref:OLC1v1019642C1 n=1 Tax=Oldenlandia corymbosa var. corymbosa TaxID=529605 RepID=A0AAV1EEM7_OLDCO|nr:OLC1v1019642C1 [Oldenlandia corymbosa var. corymbosa]